MADFFQTRRAYALTAAALAALLLVPFFLVDVPPILDYPNHLARLYVLAFGADDPILSRMYEPAWSVLPNLAVDLVGPPLMRVFGVEFGGKAVLAGALLLPAAGAVAYNRVAFGKFSYWPLAAGLVAFNGIFFLGFMNFLIGAGVAFFGAAFWMFMRPRNLFYATLGAAAFAIVCLFCHLIAALLLGLLIGAHEIGDAWVRRKENGLWRDLAVRALALTLAFAPLIPLYALGMSSTAGAPWVWNSLEIKINGLFAPFLVYDRIIGVLTGVAVFILMRAMSKRWCYHPGAIVALIILAPIYAAAPQIMHGGSFVDVRVTLMMALLLFAGAQPSFSPRFAWAAAAAVAGLLIVRTANVALAWTGHRSDLADFRRVVRSVEPGARVLAARVVTDSASEYDKREPASRRIPTLYRTDLHLPALLLLEHRAFWPLLFADPHQQPLRVRAPYDRIAMPLGETIDVQYLAADDVPPSVLAYAPYLRHRWTEFEYVLVLRAGAMANPAALRPDKLTLIDASDTAALYRVRR